MNGRKKIGILALLLCAALCLSSCGGSDPDEKRYAMVTNPDGVDTDVRTAAVFDGLQAAAGERPCTATLYKVEEETAKAYKALYKTARKDGAKLIFGIGSDMRVPLYNAQKANSKVHFAAVEMIPVSEKEAEEEKKTGDDGAVVISAQAVEDESGASSEDPEEAGLEKNTTVLRMAHREAGFLAGYALVAEGNTALGFLGGDNSKEAMEYLNGFILGADRAAEERALAAGLVTIRIHFMGSNDLDPRAMDQALRWYEGGVRAILAPYDGLLRSAAKAAEATDLGMVAGIGVVDLSKISSRLLFTAVEDYSQMALLAARAFEADSLPGGKIVRYGIAEGCVSIRADFTRFTNFTNLSYSMLTGNVSNGDIRINDGDVTAGTGRIAVLWE